MLFGVNVYTSSDTLTVCALSRFKIRVAADAQICCDAVSSLGFCGFFQQNFAQITCARATGGWFWFVLFLYMTHLMRCSSSRVIETRPGARRYYFELRARCQRAKPAAPRRPHMHTLAYANSDVYRAAARPCKVHTFGIDGRRCRCRRQHAIYPSSGTIFNRECTQTTCIQIGCPCCLLSAFVRLLKMPIPGRAGLGAGKLQ